MDREMVNAAAGELARYLFIALNIVLWIGFGGRYAARVIESDARETFALAALVLGAIGTHLAVTWAVRRLEPPYDGVVRTE